MWTLAATSVAATMAAVSWILASDDPLASQVGAAAWLVPAAGLLAATLAAAAAVADRRSRAVWALLAAALACDALTNVLVIAVGRPPMSSSWLQVPDLMAYAALAAGLIFLIHQRYRRTYAGLRLDGLVIGLCAGAATVTVLFDPMAAEATDAHPAVAYAVLVLVLVIVVVSALAVTRFRPDPSTAMAMAGAAAVTVGAWNAIGPAADGTTAARLLEAAGLVGVLLVALSPWALGANHDPDQDVSLRLPVLPGLAAVIALGLIGLGLVGHVPLLASLLAMAAVGVALLRIQRTVQELHAANDAFREARTDDLTGLLNRRGFAEALDARLTSAGDEVGVLEIDLDGFKEVNDSLGHGAGDRLLTIVAKRFRRAAPPTASVARLGGDEFAVVLPGNPALAEQTACALLRTLDDPVAVDGLSIRTGASIGIAHTRGQPLDRGELLRAADVAMYEAKGDHRGWAWYAPGHDPHSRERLSLIEDLRVAVEDQRLEMHYQPTVDLVSGRVVGMEALVRWYHPLHGRVPPERFLPLAEQARLMPAITRSVVDLSLAHLAHVHRLGHELRLSVNISAQDLVDDGLVGYVRGALAAHDLSPGWITIEVTETDLAADTARAERTLAALRETGIRVSIDDFGVGYSSLSRLLHLPVDELKIDRSFLVDLTNDVRAQAILSATVEFGRALGLDVVAEGVETSEVLTLAAARGVDLVQGFLFSQPLPSAAFDRFLAASDTPLLLLPAGWDAPRTADVGATSPSRMAMDGVRTRAG